jgi:hypothetical protein
VVEAEAGAREVRVERAGGDQIVLQVHVHNQAAPAEVPQPPRARRRTLRPMFTGRLFGWEEHYEPIAKKMQPLLAGRERNRKPGLFGRLRRLGLLLALLAAVVAVGCHVL